MTKKNTQKVLLPSSGETRCLLKQLAGDSNENEEEEEEALPVHVSPCASPKDLFNGDC